jgi:thiol-disulfide isomerase/thioredoxin
MSKKEDVYEEGAGLGVNAMGAQRRMLVAAGILAAGAGLGAAWWTLRAPKAQMAEPVSGFWAWQWPRPEGGQLALQTFHSRPLLINFWATWCAPCVEELPLIDDFFKKIAANGVQVIGVAVDQMPSVQAFLKKTPLSFPVGVAGLAGAEAARSLGDLSGGLPFSVVLDSSGNVVLRKAGRLTEQDLAALVGLK